MEEVTGEDRWQIMTERTLEFREKDKGDKDKRVEGRRWRKETQKNGRGKRRARIMGTKERTWEK